MNRLIKDIKAQVESITINNDDELVNANALAKEINKGINDIKKEFKPLKAQAKEAHNAVVKQEKDELEPWQNAKALLKKAIGEYMVKAEEKRKKEIEAKKEAEEIFGTIPIVITVPSEKPKLGGTHIREVWEVEITDPDAVPIKYGNIVIRDINMKALKDIAKFEEGKAEIDGVRFFKKKVTVIR